MRRVIYFCMSIEVQELIKMKKIILLISFICSLFVSAPVLQAQGEYSAINWAEIATAALRGPLAGLSNYYYGQKEHTGKIRAIHVLTDSLRLANIILSARDFDKYTALWALIDGINLFIDSLQGSEPKAVKNDDPDGLSNFDDLYDDDDHVDHDKHEIIDDKKPGNLDTLLNQLRATCLYGILPIIESTTALTIALSVDDGAANLDNNLFRLRLKAVQSLGRSINIFLNAKTKTDKIAAALFVLLNIKFVSADFAADELVKEQIRDRIRLIPPTVICEYSETEGLVATVRHNDGVVDRVVIGFVIPGTQTPLPAGSVVRLSSCCNHIEYIQDYADRIRGTNACPGCNRQSYHEINLPIPPDAHAWLADRLTRRREILNAYRLLEVEPMATRAEIRANYLRLSRTCHTDRNPNEVETRMQELNRAYDLLTNRNQRTTEDENLWNERNRIQGPLLLTSE